MNYLAAKTTMKPTLTGHCSLAKRFSNKNPTNSNLILQSYHEQCFTSRRNFDENYVIENILDNDSKTNS